MCPVRVTVEMAHFPDWPQGEQKGKEPLRWVQRGTGWSGNSQCVCPLVTKPCAPSLTWRLGPRQHALGSFVTLAWLDATGWHRAPSCWKTLSIVASTKNSWWQHFPKTYNCVLKFLPLQFLPKKEKIGRTFAGSLLPTPTCFLNWK